MLLSDSHVRYGGIVWLICVKQKKAEGELCQLLSGEKKKVGTSVGGQVRI